MKCWVSAGRAEKKQFEAISIITLRCPYLMDFLFHPLRPELKNSADELLNEARGFSSTDYLLVKLCLDLWCDQGKFKVHELFKLEPDIFKQALQALEYLAS